MLVGPIVQYSYPLPRLLADGIRFGDADRAYRFRDLDEVTVDDQLAALAKSEGVEYISLQKLLCRTGACTTTDASGDPIQFDSTHLTAQGSLLVANRMKDQGFLP